MLHTKPLMPFEIRICLSAVPLSPPSHGHAASVCGPCWGALASRLSHGWGISTAVRLTRRQRVPQPDRSAPCSVSLVGRRPGKAPLRGCLCCDQIQTVVSSVRSWGLLESPLGRLALCTLSPVCLSAQAGILQVSPQSQEGDLGRFRSAPGPCWVQPAMDGQAGETPLDP